MDPLSVDDDGDGFSEEEGDCDDGDPTRAPGIPEICNNRDDDCDPTTWAELETVDLDVDGSPACADCDDQDAVLGSIADDADCDAVLASVDCDDADATLGDVANDADCDGLLSWLDCDDDDGVPRDATTDADCDGSPDDVDCDDADPRVFPGSTLAWDVPSLGRDGDCDGALANHLVELAVSYVGTGYEEEAGATLGRAGDVNGDGLADFLICGPGHITVPTGGLGGRTYLVFGSRTLPATPQRLADAPVQFHGETFLARFGSSLTSLGDLDADGLDDVMLRSHWGAHLFYGSRLVPGADFLPEDADVTIAVTPQAGHGPRLVRLRDIDADGRDEVLVGYAAALGVSRLFLYLGSQLLPGATLDEDAAYAVVLSGVSGDQFAFAVADAGDVDNDGRGDLLVGAPMDARSGAEAGAAYLFLGHQLVAGGEILARDAHVRFLPEAPGDQLGASVAGAGDLNSDARDDVLVGAPYHSGPEILAGRAYLFFGAALRTPGDQQARIAPATFTGSRFLQRLGTSLSFAGDVDADGGDDVLVGSMFGASLHLSGTVMRGGDFPDAQADVVFEGEYDGARPGSVVSGGGDVDGDGRADLLIAAPRSDVAVGLEGKTYLLPNGW